MPIRALHLIKIGQGATWAWRQIRELLALGVDVHVGVPAGPATTQFSDLGATIHQLEVDLPVRQPHRIPGVLAGIRRLVDDVQPDLLHAHNVGPALAMRLALGRQHALPRIFEVPGPLHLEHAFFRRAEIVSAGHADSWIATCEYTRRLYLAAGVAPERVASTYAGTDVWTFKRGPAGGLRRELGLAPSTRLVGMVAYMYAPKRHLGQRRGLKGHEDLIDAVALLREAGRNVDVAFVGGAWVGAVGYERVVRQYGAERLGAHAHFLGTRPDVPALYPDFDVVAHPSHSENVGGAAESLLLEVPTVASSVGGFPEVVRPGETGWLVPPRDPAALAHALADALDHPQEARAMAARGRALVLDLFDVRRTAADVFDEYQRRLTLSAQSG